MPQLMPFYWVSSIFILFFILLMLDFLYFLKYTELMDFNMNNKFLRLFDLKW